MCISEGEASGLSHMYNNLETLVLSPVSSSFSLAIGQGCLRQL